MAQIDDETPKIRNTITTYRRSSRRGFVLQRRKLPTLRLGGDKKPRRGYVISRILRDVRSRWLRLDYTRMLKKLNKYYKNLLEDITADGVTIGFYQQGLVMETSMAVPAMCFSYPSYPSMAGSIYM